MLARSQLERSQVGPGQLLFLGGERDFWRLPVVYGQIQPQTLIDARQGAAQVQHRDIGVGSLEGNRYLRYWLVQIDRPSSVRGRRSARLTKTKYRRSWQGLSHRHAISPAEQVDLNQVSRTQQHVTPLG